MGNIAYIHGAPRIRTLDDTSCCVCGIIFAVPAEFLRDRRESGADYHCPNGHILVFHETALDRAKKQIAEKQRELEAEQRLRTAEREARERAERQLSAAKGEVTKARKRAANGVCPCCHRTFKQLAAHMKTKHPSFAKNESEK